LKKLEELGKDVAMKVCKYSFKIIDIALKAKKVYIIYEECKECNVLSAHLRGHFGAISAAAISAMRRSDLVRSFGVDQSLSFGLPGA